NRREILASVLGVLLVLVSVFATVVYRNWKYEQEIAGLLWMIDKRELEPLTTLTGPKHVISKLSLISQMVADSRMMNLSEDTYRYRGHDNIRQEAHLPPPVGRHSARLRKR
ncbi:hypothetical protein MRX96_054057, partial [Rhipicephalus microplus]